tara:strand:+ start:191 stop:496 length:306 start_codon:yes stop_codon:yes gene_type:complete
MPILKSDYNLEDDGPDTYEPENVAYDCDGLPYVIPEDSNLLTDHFQSKWRDQVEDDVIFLWKYIQNYVYDHQLPILENAKYIDFLHFICRNSIKYPLEVNL